MWMETPGCIRKMKKICKNLREGHTYDRVKMYNQGKRDQEGEQKYVDTVATGFYDRKVQIL